MAPDPLKYLLSQDINILLVCPSQEVLNELREKILELVKPRTYACRVHICRSLTDVKSWTDGNYFMFFDFIVFIAQAELLSALDNIFNDLSVMDAPYPRNKMCILCLGCNFATTLKPSDAWDFAKCHQINLIMGSITDDVKAEHMCNRMLNLVQSACGLFGPSLINKISTCPTTTTNY